MQWIGTRLRWKGSLWVLGDTDWDCQHENHLSKLTISTGELVARIFQEIRRTSKRSEIVETVRRCWFLEEGLFFVAIEEGPEILQTACLQYTQSRFLETSRPRGGLFKYEDRSSLGVKLCPHEGRYCNIRSNHCLRTELFRGFALWWYQQIDSSVKGNIQWEYWLVHQHRETCGKCWTKTEISCEFVYQCDYSRKIMDRHWMQEWETTQNGCKVRCAQWMRIVFYAIRLRPKTSAELPEDQKLWELCKDTGFLEKIGNGQFFITIEEGSEIM